MSQTSLKRRQIYRLVLLLSVALLVISIGLFVVTRFLTSRDKPLTGYRTPAAVQPSKPTPQKPSNPENKPVALTNTQLLVNYLNAYGRNNGSYPADVSPKNFTPETLGFPARASKSVIGTPEGYAIAYTPLPSGCSGTASSCTSYTLQLRDDATNEVLFDGISPTN